MSSISLSMVSCMISSIIPGINQKIYVKANKTINFKQLANQIAEVTDNVWKLYDFIYKNKDLALLNESLLFGHSSLKAHVLLISNLIVSDYLNNKFK